MWCVVLARQYRGLKSLVLCSSINKCCCSIYICKDSQQFIIFSLSHACNNCRICSGLPQSCLLLRMWIAYAERGLLVFIYLMCSRYLTTYDCQSEQHRIFCMFYIAACKLIEIQHRLGHDRPRSHPFHFIIHKSRYYPVIPPQSVHRQHLDQTIKSCYSKNNFGEFIIYGLKVAIQKKKLVIKRRQIYFRHFSY